MPVNITNVPFYIISLIFPNLSEASIGIILFKSVMCLCGFYNNINRDRIHISVANQCATCHCALIASVIPEHKNTPLRPQGPYILRESPLLGTLPRLFP